MNGRFKIYDDSKKQIVDTTELSMSGDGLMMKLPVQKVKAGDVISKAGRFYFVKDVNDDNEVKVVSLDDSKIETFAPETNLLGIAFYTTVVSVLGGFGGEGTTTNPMNFIMMNSLLEKKGSIGGNDNLMTMFALQSLNGNGAGFEGLFANPMMAMMLMGGEGKSGLSDMLPLMMMGGMTGGANPLGNIFGTAPAAVTPAKKPTKKDIEAARKLVAEADAAAEAAKAE